MLQVLLKHNVFLTIFAAKKLQISLILTKFVLTCYTKSCTNYNEADLYQLCNFVADMKSKRSTTTEALFLIDRFTNLIQFIYK